jgi:hypothetical protein
MECLKKTILKLVSGEQGKLAAWVIDDEIVEMENVPEAEWQILKESLIEFPQVLKAVMQELEAHGHNPTGPPTHELLNACFKAIDVMVPDRAKLAIDRCTRSAHVLQEIFKFLSELGFEVACHSQIPKVEVGLIPDLLLLDYNLQPEEQQGSKAENLLDNLTRISERENTVPPFVVLMSQKIDKSDIKTWTELAERAGFFRFHFEFLHKESFRRNPGNFGFALLSFLKHRKVSYGYFEQIRALHRETANISSRVANNLLQITPSEAKTFQARMWREGLKLSEVFTSLFAEAVTSGIVNSPCIDKSMQDLEKAISSEGLPVVAMEECGKLHSFCAELLHKSTVADEKDSPQFGDIYENESGQIFLVVSQECDLVTGEGRKSKIDRVLVIEGAIKEKEADLNSRSIVCKPFPGSWGGSRKWIWWDLKKPTVLKIQDASRPLKEGEELAGVPNLVRRYRLRFSDADQIQQAFASHLTRVGTAIQPSPIQVVEAILKNQREESKSITLYVLRQRVEDDEIETLVAIAPPSRADCMKLGEEAVMSVGLISQLSCFSPLKEFSNQLKEERIFLCEENGSPILLKSLNREPRGLKQWKGLE